jgi:hypothetical protein
MSHASQPAKLAASLPTAAIRILVSQSPVSLVMVCTSLRWASTGSWS